MMKRIFLLLLVFLVACSVREETNSDLKQNAKEIAERKIIPIKLAGNITDDDSEISGLTWSENELIILPQFPHKFSNENDGIIWKINKSEIEMFLNNRNQPIKPEEIQFKAEKFKNILRKSDSGLEAIAFNKDTVFVSVEYVTSKESKSIILSGIYDKQINMILLKRKIAEIKREVNIHNFSEESILYRNGFLYTFYEANGKNISENAASFKINIKNGLSKKVDFPNVEYRITDVTQPDPDGKFWAMNYMYPGEYGKCKVAADSLILNYGIGKSHKSSKVIERILEFEIEENRIRFSNKSPIYLILDKESRNWEGIAKYDNKGFIIATDKFPETILAFVKTD